MAFACGAEKACRCERGLLVTRVPLALQSSIEIGPGLVGVGLAITLNVVLSAPDTQPVTLVSDATGLAVFATTGAIVATEVGVSAFGVVAIATINAVGGGTVADILLDRTPFILFEDFYASCAVLGASVYWVAGTAGVSESTAAAVCAGVTVVTRIVAVAFDWQLSTVQRPGA